MSTPFSTCFCDNVDFQTYAHTVGMRCPHIERYDGWVIIDVCIATEIAELWHLGIKTLNSCCGHQKARSWVIVARGHDEAMQRLGYTCYVAPSGMKAFRLKTGTVDKPDIPNNHNPGTAGEGNTL